MTDENKEVNEMENQRENRECFCQSKWFRKFLVTTAGTFVGVFCALSLFAALHKPPMPPCPFGYSKMMRPPMHCQHHFGHHRGMRPHFHQDMKKKDFQRPNKDFGKRPPVRPEVPTVK